VFVKSDAPDGGTGNQDAPANTLEEGLAASNDASPRIYVCGPIDEAVDVPPGRFVHGDIDCSNGWVWDFSVRTEWTAPADQVPLRTSLGEQPTVVSGFRIVARDAVTAGASSIAVLSNGGTLELSRSDVVAGDGAAGANGTAGAAGAAGTNGGASTFGDDEGGIGATSSCGGAAGGNGAFRICIQNQNGGCTAGPVTQATPSPGAGGFTFTSSCTDGDAGTPGIAGSPGVDATGSGVVGVDGFVPAEAGPGTPGGPGGPGGGGGAQLDDWEWGGGGATGGCGAAGSTGGKSGGSSFAFLTLDAEILFEDVTATVGNGGSGGIGGGSAAGGPGGIGGVGGCSATPLSCLIAGTPACSGGDGGVGGAGGAGGNGGGGHAAILARHGTASDLAPLSAQPPTSEQAGASGGGSAPNGQATLDLEFP
jgi:hypothetical protein